MSIFCVLCTQKAFTLDAVYSQPFTMMAIGSGIIAVALFSKPFIPRQLSAWFWLIAGPIALLSISSFFTYTSDFTTHQGTMPGNSVGNFDVSNLLTDNPTIELELVAHNDHTSAATLESINCTVYYREAGETSWCMMGNTQKDFGTTIEALDYQFVKFPLNVNREASDNVSRISLLDSQTTIYFFLEGSATWTVDSASHKASFHYDAQQPMGNWQSRDVFRNLMGAVSKKPVIMMFINKMETVNGNTVMAKGVTVGAGYGVNVNKVSCNFYYRKENSDDSLPWDLPAWVYLGRGEQDWTHVTYKSSIPIILDESTGKAYIQKLNNLNGVDIYVEGQVWFTDTESVSFKQEFTGYSRPSS
jgi:hypothetical protein